MKVVTTTTMYLKDKRQVSHTKHAATKQKKNEPEVEVFDLGTIYYLPAKPSAVRMARAVGSEMGLTTNSTHRPSPDSFASALSF